MPIGNAAMPWTRTHQDVKANVGETRISSIGSFAWDGKLNWINGNGSQCGRCRHEKDVDAGDEDRQTIK